MEASPAQLDVPNAPFFRHLKVFAWGPGRLIETRYATGADLRAVSGIWVTSRTATARPESAMKPKDEAYPVCSASAAKAIGLAVVPTWAVNRHSPKNMPRDLAGPHRRQSSESSCP